jgi:cell wall assembly regulator SMI1
VLPQPVSIDAIWGEISALLKEDYPEIEASLCNGAKRGELERLEQYVGLSLPDDS